MLPDTLQAVSLHTITYQRVVHLVGQSLQSEARADRKPVAAMLRYVALHDVQSK